MANATTHSVPEPPTNLHASASGAERINLSWRAPSDQGSSAITGYRIEVSASGLGGWEEVVASTTRTSYSHTGLEPSTVYHYRVYATNTSGRSDSSERAWAATQDGNHDRFIKMRSMRAGVNSEEESNTSKIIQLDGGNNVIEHGVLNFINPWTWDHYPRNGTDEEKQRFLRDERVALAVEVDQNAAIIDKIVTEITYNYPSYPVEGYVTVTYTDRGTRAMNIAPSGQLADLVGYYGICGTDSERQATYANRTELIERFNYDSCPMLRYNGNVTVIIRAYSETILLQCITMIIEIENWKER